ncbi:glycosyltransferase [Thalassotalea sp. HSM 43]|uniref:glycosyltransferase n=1 Tax=Thalassotalea sp. HSM 43 TaxID=2552945 RepID=UPI0016767B62|nr:glycosyltransferase [Thalassotalea sp. HSM 43]
MSKSVLVITNLYPVPWAPNRASFNRTQFQKLAQYHQLNMVVLVGWLEWWRHRHQAKSSEHVLYCPYFYIPKFARSLVPFFQYLSLLCLLSRIRAFKASAILASWGYPDAVAVSMLNRHLKLPMFVKVHGTDINEHIQYPRRRRLMRKYLGKVQGIFVVSKDLQSQLKAIGIADDKLWLNYNGVDQQLFHPEDNQQANRCIFIGSLIASKGVNELIEAFVQLSQGNPEYHLDVVGEGPLYPQLQQQIIAANMQQQISLHGSIAADKVSQLLAKSSLLILPSYREGVPNVVLEAFACGVPVVATNVGGIPEVVTEQSGILVRKGDAQQLHDAIEKAMHNVWDKQQILAHAGNFNWQRNVDFVRQRMELI